MDGDSGLTLTGQLGDVMKESVSIALSYLRSRGLAGDLASKKLHVHVPAGAVPKDGPSAGVTMTTALASLASGRPVRSSVGMTGEVTLQGKVLPIGGVKQKLLAAHRAGLTDVIIPKRNEPDLDDLPESVRGQLRVHPVARRLGGAGAGPRARSRRHRRLSPHPTRANGTFGRTCRPKVPFAHALGSAGEPGRIMYLRTGNGTPRGRRAHGGQPFGGASYMTQTISGAVEGLRAAMTGPVFVPGDPGYDEARNIWNGDIDRHPAVVARCTGPDDVAAALGYAREQGLEVAVRGGGHGYWGAAVPENGLMINLSALDAVTVDPQTRRARVGGGAEPGPAGRGDPGARPGRAGRDGQPHRGRRADAGRRLRLAHPAARADHRQPGVLRGRAGRRPVRAGQRDRAPGPVLGAARRRRQLRGGHRVRVPAARGRADHPARDAVRGAGPGRARDPHRP